MVMRRLAPSPTDAWGPLPPHATLPRRASALRYLERLLFAIAVVCLGYYGYVWGESQLYQAYENRELDAILQSAPRAAALPAPLAASRTGVSTVPPRRSEPKAGSPL